MLKQKSQREHRAFSDDYKQKVLELISVGDKTVSQIGRDLDLTPSAVQRWIKADRKDRGIMTQNSLSETDQQELKRLRVENKRLQMAREILKKATAFFAKDSL